MPLSVERASILIGDLSTVGDLIGALFIFQLRALRIYISMQSKVRDTLDERFPLAS